MNNIKVSVGFGRLNLIGDKKYEPPTLLQLVSDAIDCEISDTPDYGDIELAAQAAIDVVRRWDANS